MLRWLGSPVIRDAAVSILAPGGVVGSTVRIRITAHIPLVVPGGETFGLGPLTTVSAETTFRQEGWQPRSASAVKRRSSSPSS